MKFMDEYRNIDDIEFFLEKIEKQVTRQWSIMEVCGGQTHSILKYGIDKLLPPKLNLLHGPGCPVCVTPSSKIDQAISLSQNQNVILCTFGDMLRVPGTHQSLEVARASGGDVRALYSPLDAVTIADENPHKEVVFFAVGFETTAPANALAVVQAKKLKLKNFSLLVSHVLVPPAIDALMKDETAKIDAFLAAGHVCAIMGEREYKPIVEKHKVPIVITGFEPLDIVQGIYWIVRQLESGSYKLENQYSRIVNQNGNLSAQKIINEVFQLIDRDWRGIGEITQSGLALTSNFSEFDAEKKFQFSSVLSNACHNCRSGEVLMGILKPDQCQYFGDNCHPESPLGATMVSQEGACHAYYLYRENSK